MWTCLITDMVVPLIDMSVTYKQIIIMFLNSAVKDTNQHNELYQAVGCIV